MFIQSSFSHLVNAIDSRILTGVAMMVAGVILMLCVGFAPVAEVHNATHDTRHATGFPCH